MSKEQYYKLLILTATIFVAALFFFNSVDLKINWLISVLTLYFGAVVFLITEFYFRIQRNIDKKYLNAPKPAPQMPLAQRLEYPKLKNHVLLEKYKIINLSQLSEGDLEFIKKSGLSIKFIKENKTNPEPNFQIDAIKNKYVSAVCPKTGKILKSNCSFSIGILNMFYEFSNGYEFYIGTNHHFTMNGEKESIFIPELNLILIFERIRDDQIKKTMIACEELVKFLEKNQNAMAEYRIKEKQTAVIVSGNHFAHHIWNELTGIYSLYENNLLDKVDKYIFCNEPMGSIDKIFPEIDSAKVIRIKLANLKNEILQNNYFAVRPFGIFINENIISRIYQLARKECPLEIMKKMNEAKENCFPLLWITVRAFANKRNMMLDSQNEIMENVIKNLYKKFPRLGIVFDGFSVQNGKRLDENPEIIQTIEEENKQIKKIINSLPPEIKCYNTNGCSLYESVVWANSVDFYISQIGSSYNKIAWTADKPGIIHGPKLRDTELQRQAKKNSVNPVYISAKEIYKKDSEDFSTYKLDWQILAKEAIKIAEQLEQRPAKNKILQNRISVIKQIIKKINAKTYLEIGVLKGLNFSKIDAPQKIAIDPKFRFPENYIKKQNEEYFETTSDEFFKNLDSLSKNKNFDVVFVDGLHSYEQSLKDVLNSLEHLKENGVIVMHDCNPQSPAAAHKNKKEATTLKLDGFEKPVWNGDVWKTIVFLRSQRNDLKIFTLNCDHGLGIITKGTPENMLELKEEDIKNLTYKDLEENRINFLNLKSVEYFKNFLDSLNKK